MLPKTTIERIGGFDPLFFHYGEDDNYCQRVLYHSLKIAVTTNTVILHDRDDRDGNIRSEFIKDQTRRGWLTKISNVFNDSEESEKRQLRKMYASLLLKNVAFLNFKNAVKYYKEFSLRRGVMKEAVMHKKMNRKAGLNWL